jgi:hypothetical protein
MQYEYERQSREARQHANTAGDPGRGRSISAPVGLRQRISNVTNTSTDKETIIGLLASIPSTQGGKAEEWGVPPPPGPSGQCSKILADAIWTFQDHWKRAGIFRNIDGVVDPGGNTLRQLNALAVRHGGGRAMPVDPRPSPWIQMDDWYVTNLSLSGGSLVAVIGGGAYWGTIDFEHYSNLGSQKLSGSMAIAGVGSGASVGIPGLKDNGLLQKALKFVADNGGISLGDLPSKTIGLCFPNKGSGVNTLSSVDFFGGCVTHFISGSVFVGSVGAWALYFGLPRDRNWATYLAQSMLPGGTAIVGQQAKGMALIHARGFALAASAGASYNAYGGEIA